MGFYWNYTLLLKLPADKDITCNSRLFTHAHFMCISKTSIQLNVSESLAVLQHKFTEADKIVHLVF